ncbi:uncharacterized protein [Procambarus clarkii]|uniref:uncharacterized protein n=1 Tax=Procambarus clarkii TaxID=6728 RepID=UPI003743F7C2
MCQVRPYDKTVEITELEVPESPRAGDDVTLTCRFKLHGSGHNLYTVNWWRGKDQFYTYKGTNHDSKHAFTFRGIQVKKEESTRESVVLKNVSEDTSGVFKCEVMGEGPSFRTAVETKVMNVIVPPKTVEVHSWADPDPPTYRAGETIQINCTARGAKPRAHIMWEINGRPVSCDELAAMVVVEQDTSTIVQCCKVRQEVKVLNTKSRNNAVLPSAQLQLNGKNSRITTRGLFDQGSQRTFITQQAANQLKLKPLCKVTLNISGFLADTGPQEFEVVQPLVRLGGYVRPVKAIVVNHIPLDMNVKGLRDSQIFTEK